MAEPRVTLTVRLPPDIYEEARQAADDDGVSVNELVARAIHQYAHIREALVAHLAWTSDPCQDRGTNWPCDVARAITNDTKEPQ